MPRKKAQVVEEEVNERNIALALKTLCEEKGLPTTVVVDAMSEALKKAYFKFSDDYPDTIINVNVDLDTGEIKMTKVKNVVEEITDDVFETDPEEAFDETGVHYKVGDIVETPIDISSFRRAAAMQAKSVFKQKLREAEKQLVVDQFSDKVGDVLVGIVEAVEEKHCIIKIGSHTNAYLSKAKMLPNETLRINNAVKVYVEEVDKAVTGAPVIVSRTHPRFITRLMEQDISEISEGIVEIKGIARQPGFRSKVAVSSKDANIDPSGSCIGPHGQRINRVISQIGNEKIDVINYNDNPLLYVADALKPAEVVGVAILDEENKQCRAIVNDNQYSLAIGKDAQNVNLAVRLTGWKIDIKSVSDAMENGYEYQNVADLKIMENAKKARANMGKKVSEVVENKVEPTKPQVEIVAPIEDVIINEPAIETTTPVVKEEIIVKPTKSKTPNMFSELEAALNESTSTTEEKQVNKKKTKAAEKTEEKVETNKKVNKSSNVLPTYTEEELRAIQEEEEAEEASKYDEDIDYDAFDDFYDDENYR